MSERELIFEEPPEELDETWNGRGSLLGGMASCTDNLWMARAYRRCAESLIEQAADFRDWEIHPILFLYRHALELYIKGILGEGRKFGHDLEKLGLVFAERFKEYHGRDLPDRAVRIIQEIALYDGSGTTFRYAEGLTEGEYWIDYGELKTHFDWLFNGLEKMPSNMA